MSGRQRIQLARRRVAKYDNAPTVVDGIRFASKKEARRYGELKLMERAGAIADLRLQPRFPIEVAGVAIRYPNGRQVTYVGDFAYTERGQNVIEDTKGMQTPVYKLKRALLSAMGIEIREI